MATLMVYEIPLCPCFRVLVLCCSPQNYFSNQDEDHDSRPYLTSFWCWDFLKLRPEKSLFDNNNNGTPNNGQNEQSFNVLSYPQYLSRWTSDGVMKLVAIADGLF